MALRPVYAGVPCAALPSHWTDSESTKQMRKKNFKSKTASLSLILNFKKNGHLQDILTSYVLPLGYITKPMSADGDQV